MPVTLPNSGLVCPEAGDPTAQACAQVKELFTYVDSLPTTADITLNPCVTIPSTNWTIQGPPDCKEFKQTVAVPDGINPFKTSMSVVDSDGCLVNLCIEIVSISTICVLTNTPSNYELIFG